MNFKMSLNPESLSAYLRKQLFHFFPDQEIPCILNEVELALDRTFICFSKIRKKYFVDESDQNIVLFDHLNGDHMAAFLYYLSKELIQKSERIAVKVFSLNKALHGLDLYHGVSMPDVFRLAHPVGTVLGAAGYSNYFVVYQGCTVGSDEDGVYPNFDEGVILYANSRVIGNCRIGKNVVFAANSFILNTNVPDNSIVVGQFPSHKILPNNRSVLDRMFK